MKPIQKFECLSQEETLSQQVYWLNRFSGTFPAAAPLVYTAKTVPRPYEPAAYDFRLPADLSAAIYRQARGSAFSAYLILLAALKVVLHRYTRRSEVIVLPPACRSELDRRAPANLVPLRSKVRADLSFKDLLLQVRQTALEA